MNVAGPAWVIGANGMLGRELVAALTARDVHVVATGHEADVADRASLVAALAGRVPCCIFNAAAYTAVDAAESAAERAFTTNAVGAGVVAELARDLDADLVHFSTDYVFDGTTPRLLREDTPPSPRGVYATSKREGEMRVLATLDADRRVTVLRTSWLFSAHPRSFVARILQLAMTRDELRVVADQHGKPTAADDLATVAIALGLGRPAIANGVLHFANPGGVTNWHAFATAICDAARRHGIELRAHTITPLATEDALRAAPRPAWSVLDCTTVERYLGHRGMLMRSWSEALDAHVQAFALHRSQARSSP